VTIKGGYAGAGQADPNARDIELYESVLSGDLDGNDLYVAHARGLFSEPTRGENSYNVVESTNPDESGVLDGLTIIGGNANGRYFFDSFGGGILIWGGGAPTLRRCRFEGNCADTGGALHAGGYGDNDTRPKIRECVFVRNGAGYGGAISCRDVFLQIDACRITNNMAYQLGAGVFCKMGDLTVGNSVISGNLSSDELSAAGGGIAFVCCWGCAACGRGGTLRVVNSKVTGNIAKRGAGIFMVGITGAEVKNCIIGGNLASEGEGAVEARSYLGLRIENCIVWGNYPEGITDRDGNGVIIYNNVQGGWGGPTNIEADPCFVEEGHWDAQGTPEDANDDIWLAGDYHLKSQGGRWDADEGRWTMDEVTSPCIDAGDPMSPTGHEAFPNGGIINMGAYGGTVEASKSYFGKPACETIIAGDVNGDCAVDFRDFQLMAFHWCEDSSP
jgi:hypothetical protein